MSNISVSSPKTIIKDYKLLNLEEQISNKMFQPGFKP